MTPLLPILVCAGVTALLRLLPFLLFRGRPIPRLVSDLGRLLPPAIIAILVIYCLKGAGVNRDTLLQFLAVLATALMHLWRRNSLLSVFTGTAVYMLLIRIPL